MANDTLRCPCCQYENIILTCGFCIQCGSDLSELMPRLETISASPGSGSTDSAACKPARAENATTTIESNVVAEQPRGAATRVALDRLVSNAAGLLGTPARDTNSGWKFSLPTTKGRDQTVYVLRGNHDQAQELVSFLSICGEATAANAMALLEWNGRLTGCAFATRTINGKRMFVLTANWPTDLLDVGLVTDTLTKIARRADQVEAKLTSGPDKF